MTYRRSTKTARSLSVSRSSRLSALTLTLTLTGVMAVACSKTPEPDATSTPAREPAAAKPSTATAKAAPATPTGPTEITWEAPASFEKAENPSPMRKATYKVKRAEGDPEDGDLSVSQAGGPVDMNIKRWVGQFETKGPDATKQTERKVGDLKVTMVEIKGTFAGSGMPGGPAAAPKPGYALLGAIVETAGNSWFFKLTGPEKTITAAKADFERLIDSIRPK